MQMSFISRVIDPLMGKEQYRRAHCRKRDPLTRSLLRKRFIVLNYRYFRLFKLRFGDVW